MKISRVFPFYSLSLCLCISSPPYTLPNTSTFCSQTGLLAWTITIIAWKKYNGWITFHLICSLCSLAPASIVPRFFGLLAKPRFLYRKHKQDQHYGFIRWSFELSFSLCPLFSKQKQCAQTFLLCRFHVLYDKI